MTCDPVVYRLAYNGDVDVFKMGRRQGDPRRTAVCGRLSKPIRNRSGGRRTAASPFSTQPSGPRPSAIFLLQKYYVSGL